MSLANFAFSSVGSSRVLWAGQLARQPRRENPLRRRL